MTYKNSHKKIFTLIIGLILVSFSGCSSGTDKESFQSDIINELPQLWKYFAVDATNTFLYDNSQGYDVSIFEALKNTNSELTKEYSQILKIWNDEKVKNGSNLYKKLVKLNEELKHQQAIELNEKYSFFEKNFPKITNKDLGITEEMAREVNQRREEKYKLCIKVLQREKFDNYWFTIKNIQFKDDYSFIQRIAILRIYFNGLTSLEVYFYQDPVLTRWCNRSTLHT